MKMSTMIEGILNIDKPGGITSHDVVNRIRALSGVRRVGHAGTLDPLATGVLLLCVGRATRLVEYLVGQRKCYEATVRLGQTTNTYDTEGEVVAERPYHHITRNALATALEQFRGTIQQRPPIYSAIKKEGQPLYKLARQGIEVDVPLRTVTLYELELLVWDLPQVDLRVACSSGTYIRSLAHDLGEALGCGGHLAALRRTAIGSFNDQEAVPLATLSRENLPDYLQKSDTAVAHLPCLHLPAEEAWRLRQGQRIQRQPDHPPADLARVYNPACQFIGIVKAVEAQWQPHKIFHPA